MVKLGIGIGLTVLVLATAIGVALRESPTPANNETGIDDTGSQISASA